MSEKSTASTRKKAAATEEPPAKAAADVEKAPAKTAAVEEAAPERGPFSPVQHDDDGWGGIPVQMRG